MTTYIELPLDGSPFWAPPVPTAAALPATDTQWAVRLVEDTGVPYYFNGTVWTPIGSLLSPGATSDTNSIDLTNTLGVVTADLRISANPADASNQIVALNIESVGSVGLRAQILDSQIRGLLSGTAPVVYNSGTGAISMPVATAIANGYLAATDWVIFNSKEPAITAGVVTDYWRGDKTFQTLQMSALLAITDGSAAPTGTIGEILTGTVASPTVTGVGASNVYGAVTSVLLTAGIWSMQGVVGLTENGAVLTTALTAGISASPTGVGISEFDTATRPFTISGAADPIINTPNVIVNFTGIPTRHYLNTKFIYTSGTPQHRGRLTARRIR